MALPGHHGTSPGYHIALLFIGRIIAMLMCKRDAYIMYLLMLLLAIPSLLMAEVERATTIKDEVLTSRQMRKLERSYARMERRMRKDNERQLARALHLEKVLRMGKDSMSETDKALYQQLQQRVQASNQVPLKLGFADEYLPRLDSLQVALRFLEGMQHMPGLERLSSSIHALSQQWQTSSAIQSFLNSRRDLLKGMLEKAGQLSQLTPLNKEVYYYQQQLNTYRSLLKQPDQLATQLIGMAAQHPQFRSFMSSNSLLAQLFGVPGTTTAPLAGLQTRMSTQASMSQRLQGVADPSQFVTGQLEAATKELNSLKDKVNRLGGTSSDMELPDFKPNTQKRKTFWKRLEWGMNIQSQRPNGLFPVTSDLALMVGYKLNDRSVIGVGAAYKLGWGERITRIRLSHQGIGLRSYVDVKWKGSVWLSGGYEMNHQQEFTRLDVLRSMDAWQRSGLIGLTKKFKTGKKTGNVQLFWDFLSYAQTPRTTALKFRIGYMF